jgi:RND family efflux transporter MFP subunit
LGLVLGAYSLWAENPAKSDGKSPQSDQAIAVTTARVMTHPVQRRVPIVGSLYGREEIPVTPEVSGRVVRIVHETGEMVSPGDVLFEIDPREYELAVNESRRSLEWELAKLGLKTPPTSDDAVAIDKLPMVVRAKAQLDLSEQVHRRASLLKAQKTISQDEWDKAEAELKLSQAAHEQAVLDARTNLAAVRQKQAMLETALERLADTKVVAPRPTLLVDNERTVTEGEFISINRGGEPAFRLVIADPLKLQAAVAERYAGEIKKGQKAGLMTEATGQAIFYGLVNRVHPTVDRASRTFQVEVEIRNKDRQLPPGAFARGAIVTRESEKALLVPAEAIVRFAGVVKVFVVRDNLSQSVPVKVGERIEITTKETKHPDGVWFEVTGDLKDGEAVVCTGQSQLADGTAVRLREVPSPAPASNEQASRASEASR